MLTDAPIIDGTTSPRLEILRSPDWPACRDSTAA